MTRHWIRLTRPRTYLTRSNRNSTRWRCFRCWSRHVHLLSGGCGLSGSGSGRWLAWLSPSTGTGAWRPGRGATGSWWTGGHFLKKGERFLGERKIWTIRQVLKKVPNFYFSKTKTYIFPTFHPICLFPSSCQYLSLFPPSIIELICDRLAGIGSFFKNNVLSSLTFLFIGSSILKAFIIS